MTVVISQIKNTAIKKMANKFDADKNGKLEGNEIELFNSAIQAKTNGEVSFWDSKWSGSKIAKLTGDNAITDWLQDKDKKCTDGKDDGKLSFKEGAKSYVKGLFGGIIKGIINHPVASAISIGIGAVACVATGGAAAPLLLAAGTALAAGTTAKGFIDYAKADNDADAKTALETAGTGTQALALSALAVKPTLKSAKAAGVDTEHGVLNTLKSSAKVSGRNIKANYVYHKTGVITQGANATRKGVQVSYQGDGKPNNCYKINIDANASVEQNLAKNPGLSYDAGKNQYYVQTSWGEPSYVDPNKGYMFVEYGPGDCNAVEGVEFSSTYVDQPKLAADGTKNYINVDALKPGQQVVATKQAPGAFKVVPEGTQYVGAEGPATVQPKSVLRIDGQGRPYQSTVEFMFKKFKNLTPEQISQLKAVDPEAAAKYGY